MLKESTNKAALEYLLKTKNKQSKGSNLYYPLTWLDRTSGPVSLLRRGDSFPYQTGVQMTGADSWQSEWN